MAVTKPRKAPLDPWLVAREERERRETEATIRREEQARPRKRSEHEAEYQRLLAEGELARAKMLGEVEKQSKANGTWIDDVARTLANLRAQFPDGNVCGAMTPVLAMAWARHMDRTAWPKECEAARAQGQPAPQRYSEAILAWWQGMLQEGRVASEGPDTGFGVVYDAAFPQWAREASLDQSHGFRKIPRSSPEEAANQQAVILQRNRFGAMEESFRLIADLVRQGTPAAGLPGLQAGANWEPWPTHEGPASGVRAHHAETTRALTWLDRNEADLRAAKLAEAQEAWEAANPSRSEAAAKLSEAAQAFGNPSLPTKGW